MWKNGQYFYYDKKKKKHTDMNTKDKLNIHCLVWLKIIWEIIIILF